MATRDEVTISGGSVAAGNIGGRGNKVEADSISLHQGSDRDAELAALRERLATLTERLAADERPEAVRAHERAELLTEELADEEPDGKRVGKLWDRLGTSVEALKLGVEFAKVGESITRLF